MTGADKIVVENVLQPDKTYRVDAAKFTAMKAAMLGSLPDSGPGLTVADLKRALLPLLPADLFPGGEKAGWWLKAVQLDQEAKGIVARAPGSPVRLYRRR